MAQRFEGRNLEEALQRASEALGVEQYKVAHHVIVEKRGFLGGIKRIVIEAFADETRQAPPSAAAPGPAAPSAEPFARESSPHQGEPLSPRSSERGRGRRRQRGGGEEIPRPRGPVRKHSTPDLPPQQEESAAARKVHEWLDEVARRSRMEYEVRTRESDNAITAELYGLDGLAEPGQILDSLQLLVSKAVGDDVGKRIVVDTAGFRDQREGALRERALSAAELVRREGGEQLLPPMNPVERRIIHLSLQDDPDVMTESRGDGFFKRVAVVRRSAAAAAADRADD